MTFDPGKIGNSFEYSERMMHDFVRKAGRIDLATAARLTPATYAAQASNGHWHPAQHLLYIAAEIAKELAKGNARLIVNVPPRHGKSEMLSVYTPLWYLDLFPKDPIILTTYSGPLSTKFSRRVRDMIAQPLNPAFHQKVRLRDDVQQADQFLTTEGGGLTAAGIGGTITGLGAKLLLIDDYLKNAQESQSPTVLNQIWEWFASVAFLRLEPGGSVIILATRWEQRDLVGKLLATDPNGRWKVIKLPALAMPGDPLGRPVGAALWPKRYSRDTLLEIKGTIGSYFFEALYQQEPTNKSDSKFETEYISIVPDHQWPHPSKLRSVRSWDLAGSEAKGDYTVGSLCQADDVKITNHEGVALYGFWVQDVIRERFTSSKVEKLIRSTAEADGPGVPIVIEQEPGSSGKGYAEYLKNQILAGFNVEIIRPQSDKWLRAQPLMASVENGRTKFRLAKWNEPALNEMKMFPGGDNDDIVDSLSGGYNYLYRKRPRSVSWGRREIEMRAEAEDRVKTAGRKSVVFGRH